MSSRRARLPAAARVALALLAAGCAPSAAGSAQTGSAPTSAAPTSAAQTGSAQIEAPAARPGTGSQPDRSLRSPAPISVPEGWTAVHHDTAQGRYTLAGPPRLSTQGCEAGARPEGRLFWQRRGAGLAEPASLSLGELWPLERQVAAFEAAAGAASGGAPHQRLALQAHGQAGADRVELRLVIELGHEDDRHEVALWALLPAEGPPGEGAPRPHWAGLGSAAHEHLGVCRRGHEAEWTRDPQGRLVMRRVGFAEVIDSAEEENSQTPAFAVARATCRPPADEQHAVP